MTCKEFACLIDKYLFGNLSDQELEDFELHYFACDDCFTQLKISERLKAKEVPIVIASRKPIMTLSGLFTWKPLLAAAALIIIIFSSIFLLQHADKMKHLYRATSFSPPVYIESETRGLNSKDTFSKAMDFYSQGDYSQTLRTLMKISSIDRNPQITFFKGICFLLTDEPKNAVKEFDLIIEEMNPSYYDEAIYYKAIALLRLNKKKKALEHLQNLSAMFSPYSPKARDMIKKVKNI